MPMKVCIPPIRNSAMHVRGWPTKGPSSTLLHTFPTYKYDFQPLAASTQLGTPAANESGNLYPTAFPAGRIDALQGAYVDTRRGQSVRNCGGRQFSERLRSGNTRVSLCVYLNSCGARELIYSRRGGSCIRGLPCSPCQRQQDIKNNCY